MIELRNNGLAFQFPEVHREASCVIDFQRTLRIPDDNKPYPLPPGMGRFPMHHIDDYAAKLPSEWYAHGGVFIPMYQSEALWINFSGAYPCAIKIAAGKINAVDGSNWSRALSIEGQDYVVSPEQPWLDGFNVAEGYIRQFVAMPLGEGYSAEEQITGKGEQGGLQLIVYPMKRDWYERLMDNRSQEFCLDDTPAFCVSEQCSMGLASGGLMRQEIYDDPFGVDAWDQDHGERCFVHLVNSKVYAGVTGSSPPDKPRTAKDYAAAGLPWFDYYSDTGSVTGSEILGGLTGLGAKFIQKKGQPLSDNDSVEPRIVKSLGMKRIVRQGKF